MQLMQAVTEVHIVISHVTTIIKQLYQSLVLTIMENIVIGLI